MITLLQLLLLFFIGTLHGKEANRGEDLLEDRHVICSSSSIDVSLSFSKSFTGSIFTERGFDAKDCRWQGNGDKSITVKVPLFNSTQCGIKTNETSGEYSVKLIISPVEGLIVDGYTAINVRCIYSTQDITLTLPPGPNGSALIISSAHTDSDIVTGSGGSPLLSMQILDGHGLDGQILTKASVGQRVTLDLVLKNTAIYDFYVHSCYAHDGTNTPDASINIIDNNGCGVRLSRAVDVPVLTSQPVPLGPKHVYLHMYGFQFTSSQFVHFECQVKPCVHSCKRKQCEPDSSDNKVPLIPALRRRREESRGNLSTIKMQTRLEIQPQQIQKAALVSSERVLEECFTMNNVIFICLLLFSATVATVILLFFLCNPRKHQSIPAEQAYSISPVFPQS